MRHRMDIARKKQMVSFALDPELILRLEAWLAVQEFPPTKTAVIESALRAFLTEREKRNVAARR